MARRRDLEVASGYKASTPSESAQPGGGQLRKVQAADILDKYLDQRNYVIFDIRLIRLLDVGRMF